MEASLAEVLDPSVDIARRAFRMKDHILEFQQAISSIGE